MLNNEIIIGADAVEDSAKMFRKLFPGKKKAVIVDDPRTKAVAGAKVAELLKTEGIEVAEHGRAFV